ncbi:ATP-binding protein [Lysobacter enzymogenes]|uniref:ATP-binding protein n=1 Tax=Lysobacter enzymogenes TaxID=69 RepID=UPI00111466E2|nr:ATP-binding protein [Lysobacter enzymogenes]
MPEIAADDVRIRGPQKFALEAPWHDDLVRFLTELRSAAAAQKRAVLDFRPTTQCVAGGTLLFFSELQRLKVIYPTIRLYCIPSKEDSVNQALQHLRIFELCGFTSHVVPRRPDIVCWKMAQGSEIDGDKVGGLIDRFSLSPDVGSHFFRGASEAMINAVEHAYVEDREDGLPPPSQSNWWMFCRETEESFFVAVCDLGIGIPRSLPKKYADEYISGAMAALSGGYYRTDSRMIQAAMELARTRTERDGRGIGLFDLKRIIDEVEGGTLHLFSNRGVVTYRNGGFTRKNFRRSIKGTVVVWTIPLKAK